MLMALTSARIDSELQDTKTQKTILKKFTSQLINKI
jgi:hypothetical protein